MNIIYVKWIDAATQSGWDKIDRDDIGIDYCEAIGFLIKQTDLDISLAATVSEKECNAIISIPKTWINDIKLIKLPRQSITKKELKKL